MPYFQRKPIEGLVDQIRVAIPGLPSRGQVPFVASPGDAVIPTSAKAVTDIVRQATEVLTSERRGLQGGGAQPRVAPATTSRSNFAVETLQQQINGFIEQIAALVAQKPAAHAETSPSDASAEFAPVLRSSHPVPPGHPTLVRLSLVNADEVTIEIALISTDLIGELDARISADRVSFEPNSVTLGPGHSHPVEVQILVPAETPEGRYTGLIRASQIDDLHAVIVVEVRRVPS